MHIRSYQQRATEKKWKKSVSSQALPNLTVVVRIPIAKTINLTRVDVKNAFQYSTQIYICLLIRAFEKQTKNICECYIQFFDIYRTFIAIYFGVFLTPSIALQKQKGMCRRLLQNAWSQSFDHSGMTVNRESERTTPWSLVPSFLQPHSRFPSSRNSCLSTIGRRSSETNELLLSSTMTQCV